MSLSLILACVWAIVANISGMFPSRHNHWPAAYALIAAGIPLLGYITLQHGPWITLLIAAAGVSILRWPVLYAIRWVRRVIVR